MFNVLGKVQQWWSNGRAAAGPPVPFALTCACGLTHTGLRQTKPQTIACSGCGQALFIFPLSPLPRAVPLDSAAVKLFLPRTTRSRPVWFWPAVGAGSTLLLVAVAFTWLFTHLPSRNGGGKGSEPARSADVKARWEKGRKQLALGKFKEASEELSAAASLLEQNPGLLPEAKERLLRNQQREAELLATWSGKPLDEILNGMAQLDDDQWQTLLDKYLKQGVFFDVDVSAQVAGTYTVDFRRRPEVGRRLQLDLQDFKLLDGLPLRGGKRLIFGAQLAEVRRLPDRPVLVRLKPDSGVFLTDVDAASIATTTRQVDQAFREAIQRQKDWVENPLGTSTPRGKP